MVKTSSENEIAWCLLRIGTHKVETLLRVGPLKLEGRCLMKHHIGVCVSSKNIVL